MALKASKLKQIPQRNKDLAFGYLKENEKQHKINYPQLIRYLVLFYSNQQDQFDSNATHQDLEISGNTITDKRNHFISKINSFLKNIVWEGVHIWIFKLNTDDSIEQNDTEIGVWKTKFGDPILDIVDLDDTTEDHKTCTGYAITMDGQKTNPNNPMKYSKEMFDQRPKNGDIIKMRLDLNENSLTFMLGDIIIARFLDIEHTTYRASISTYSKGEGLTLMSYQDIYK